MIVAHRRHSDGSRRLARGAQVTSLERHRTRLGLDLRLEGRSVSAFTMTPHAVHPYLKWGDLR